MILEPDPLSPGTHLVIDSGCQQLVGYETRIDAAGVCTVSLEVSAQHLNRNGMLHGGIAATVLDVVCGNTAALHFDPEGRATIVTVALNLSYIAATGPGRMVATASVAGGGQTTVHLIGELRDRDGALLATATGIFRRINKR